MDNYPRYIGSQGRSDMAERRLDSTQRRQDEYKQVARGDMFTQMAVEAAQVMSPMTVSHSVPPHHTGGRVTPGARNQEALMEELMMQDFEAHELALYLNTHPNDARALGMYREAHSRSRELRAEYESRFGPITLMGVDSASHWTWSSGPWPWEAR